MDIDGDGVTDVLLVGAPMYFSEGRERGRVYVYNLRQVLLRGGWQPPRGALGSTRYTGSLERPGLTCRARPGKIGTSSVAGLMRPERRCWEDAADQRGS